MNICLYWGLPKKIEQWVFYIFFWSGGWNLVNVNRNSYSIFMLVEKFQFMFWMFIFFFHSLFHFCFWLQNYFSCFFSLPIVISSMRWGVDAGRKTLVRPASCSLVDNSLRVLFIICVNYFFYWHPMGDYLVLSMSYNSKQTVYILVCRLNLILKYSWIVILIELLHF